MVYADLHTHSTFSDGVLSPEEMLTLADSLGLGAMSITDHDCLDGARWALENKDHFKVGVIPGVEISTQTDGREVHLLGYFVDLDSPLLASVFEHNRDQRVTRACAIADKLHDDGYDISSDELRESGATVNRSLLARILVEKGYAQSADDAFSRLIGSGSPYYVSYTSISTAEAIACVLEAGGVPIIAHPAHYHVVDLIEQLVTVGLAGLEAYHSLQSPSDSEQLVSFASRLGIAVSGGSDWHGDATHGARLGGAGLSREELASFLARCGHENALCGF